MKLVIVVLSVLGLLVVAGCSGAVSGQVSSKSAKKPVPAATVKVGGVSVVTDTSGRFTLDKVGTGDEPVRVAAEGFGPYSGRLNVQSGSNTLNVVLEDGTVHGVLKENAEAREPITKAKVTLAGAPVSGVHGARFDATSVPVGEQTLVVATPGHATVKKTITVTSGTNKVTVVLDLTPAETYMRYYLAYRFSRYREGYRMVHPDVRKHYSYTKFVKDMKTGGTVLSIKFFGSRNLAKWRPAYMKKTYTHVVAIDRSIRYQDAFGSYSDNYTQYWQRTEGRWYIIYDWRN